MVPYQVYEVLAAQRSRELQAKARRYERTRAARSAPAGMTAKWSSRLKDAFARRVGLVHLRGDASAGSAASPASEAGPMGCAA